MRPLDREISDLANEVLEEWSLTSFEALQIAIKIHQCKPSKKIPTNFLETLNDNQDKILKLLEQKNYSNLLDDYIPENVAKKEFGMSTTWFWERRKSGELPFVKVGGRVFYRRSALLGLFEKEWRLKWLKNLKRNGLFVNRSLSA